MITTVHCVTGLEISETLTGENVIPSYGQEGCSQPESCFDLINTEEISFNPT